MSKESDQGRVCRSDLHLKRGCRESTRELTWDVCEFYVFREGIRLGYREAVCNVLRMYDVQVNC